MMIFARTILFPDIRRFRTDYDRNNKCSLVCSEVFQARVFTNIWLKGNFYVANDHNHIVYANLKQF